MKRIVYYISSHGFGHSTRAIEVINHVKDSVAVEIVTAAPQWLFEKSIGRPFTCHRLDHDPGIVQPDSVTMDLPSTAARWSALLEAYPALAQQEADRLGDCTETALAGDISPFTVAVARQVERPCAIVANFSWDWIFSPFVKDHPEFEPIIEGISVYYAQADWLLRTPSYGDLSVFPRAADIPWIARMARTPREEIRAGWGAGAGRRVAMISFGGMGLDGMRPETLARHEDWTFITFDRSLATAPNVVLADPQSAYHPDLVNAADLVVAKLGYGLVSECIAHGKPIAYLPRHGFIEYGVLEDAIREQLWTHRIEAERFSRGDWYFLDRFARALEAGEVRSRPAPYCGGGRAAADFLVKLTEK
ncbi:MAG: hypothetical protein GC154_20215 [bacterium]|nr:hypothetical protein [bacterium]